jgi:hypothetical protein
MPAQGSIFLENNEKNYFFSHFSYLPSRGLGN